MSHVTCDPRHGARTVDALPASVYNHTVARPDLRLRAPDPATFSRIIGDQLVELSTKVRDRFHNIRKRPFLHKCHNFNKEGAQVGAFSD